MDLRRHAESIQGLASQALAASTAAVDLGDGRHGASLEGRAPLRLEQEEAVDAARAAIHRLRDKDKEVFLVRGAGGLTFEAIAKALGTPVGTAKTRMRKALASLRTSLDSFAPASLEER